MSITVQTTRRGNIIHRLSLADLIEVIENGQQLRPYCPIHGSDHQRSLAIARDTGWGYCHCCHAVVLVETLNPLPLERRWNTHGKWGDTLTPLSFVAHHVTSLRPDRRQREPPAKPA